MKLEDTQKNILPFFSDTVGNTLSLAERETKSANGTIHKHIVK